MSKEQVVSLKDLEKMSRAKEKRQAERLSQQQLEDGLLQLPPYIFESIKGRIDTLPIGLLESLAKKEPLPRRAMIDYNIPFNRHQIRQLALEALYHYLLLGKDIKKAVYDVMMGSNQISGFLYGLTVGTVENEEKYRKLIAKNLRQDWQMDRLSLLEQAILLMSAQEMLEMGTEKSVVINEAVTLAKHYCDESSPKMINGILDHLEVR